MNEQAAREREIFASALERPTAAERIAFIEGSCGTDVELRSRVTALLTAHDVAGGFLPMDGPPQTAVTASGTGAMLAIAEKPGDCIGLYKLREKVGEGGCGVVYVADQE